MRTPKPGPMIGLAALALVATACGTGVQQLRTGDPIPLASGKPASACEQQAWFDLVPARAFTTRLAGASAFGVAGEAKGLGVYRRGAILPEDLLKFLPTTREQALAEQHAERIQSVVNRDRKSMKLVFWGAGIAVGGATAALVPTSSSNFGAAYALLGVAVVGLGLEIWGLASRPNPSELAYMDLHRYLLIPGEDDVTAAQRGVSRVNTGTRARCVGSNAVSSAPPR